MGYTPTQWKAIAKFAQDNSATPQLSAYPNVRFLMPDGSIEEKHITGLMTNLNHERKLKRPKAKHIPDGPGSYRK